MATHVIHPLTKYPGTLGTPTFLVESIDLGIVDLRKIPSDLKPRKRLEKKPGTYRIVNSMILMNKFGRKFNSENIEVYPKTES